MAPRRLALWGLVSTLLAAATVLHALRKRPNFYAAAVYLAKSNACMLILWNQGIFQTVMLGKALQAIFLGELRLIEVERLQERGWFAVTETLLALTIFKDDFDSSFALLFVGLLFLKAFHWLASDRVEMMEQAAQVSRLAHARMLGLLSLLWLADIVSLVFAFESIMIDGPTVMIMFASEYLILIASVWTLSAKYIINCIDMRNEAPWEEKSVYIAYIELAADFFKLVTYLTFFGLILTFYGLPLNILRDVYLTLRSFVLKVRDLRRYRQATRNMDELYPDATREEMDAMADKTCIICREDMEWRAAPGQATPAGGDPAANEGTPPAEERPVEPPRTGPNDTPKKLPCGHVFHFHCLRSWLERQQSCPTCRRPVLPNEQPAQQTPPAGVQAERPGGAAAPGPHPAAGHGAAALPGAGGEGGAPPNREEEAIRQAQVNLARNLGREAFTALFPGIAFPPEAEDSRRRILPPGTPAQGPSPPRSPAARLAAPSPPAAIPPLPSTSSAPAGQQTPPGDNPLARFSLPSLPVPTTGEASLYAPPPTFTYPYPPPGSSAPFSDLAYGAHPFTPGGAQVQQPRKTFQMAGQGSQPPNLIERLETVRRRWEPSSSGVAAQAASAAEGPSPDADQRRADNGVVGTRTSDDDPTAPTRLDKGKRKAEEMSESEDQAGPGSEEGGLNPREAARRAAERRSARDEKKPETSATAGRAAASSSSNKEARVDEGPSPRGAPATTADASGPLSQPRLIPLFDLSDPSSIAAAAARGLASAARPGQAAAMNEVELDGAVSEALQTKLRQLAGFQDRIDKLVDEMRDTLGVNLAAGDPPSRSD